MSTDFTAHKQNDLKLEMDIDTGSSRKNAAMCTNKDEIKETKTIQIILRCSWMKTNGLHRVYIVVQHGH